MTLPPARRMSDVAYEKLRQAIIRAEFEPGVPIEEKRVMERLEVGRTPLREALQRLSQEDLVKNVPQRGYFVSTTSATDLFQLIEFRQHAEVLAARLAAARASAGHLTDFGLILAEARAGAAAGNQDLAWNIEIDERMHRLVAKASGNGYLAQALNRLYALSVRSLYLSHVPITLIRDELETMQALHDALASRDADGAEAAMRRHLDFNVVNLVASGTRPAPHPVPAAVPGDGQGPGR
ncbi:MULTISPECIES: GntR family transcriptional regulator [Inquilinus]|uniref:DNA-binding GntR family transcriptional regulator n=1 Tax=Inquilinus ginsengisoli TaxID=363840 RepID=A0ABU1JJ48_9PROT|nr:GntR family transcriptional regulator [Inquilinus ginsengisoli]MDR6288640.1 DNA-binding GntR family transcriptional regulator [Inquilinus ginsengisoli]